jgi:MYXO-CTERM domain-containing protein
MPRVLPLILVSVLSTANALAAPPLVMSAGDDFAAAVPAQVAALQRQHHAAIAYGQNVYLAVWLDELENDHASIHAVRIRASDGATLDTTPIELVASGTNSLGPPAVAFDGSLFAVVWKDVPAFKIRGNFVIPTGGLSMKAILSPTTPSTDQPVIAAGGGQAMIAYSTQGTIGITVQLIDQNGAVGAPLALGSTASALLPAIAYSPSGYLVAWNSAVVAGNNDIFGARVVPGSPSTVTLTGGLNDTANTTFVQHAAVAFDGTGFLVAWQGFRTGNANLEIGGRAVAANGTPAANDFTIAGTGENKLHPQLVAIGAQFFAFWEEFASLSVPATLMGVRVGTADTPAAASDIALAPSARLPVLTRPAAVASDGTTGRLIWTFPGSGLTLDDVYTVPVPNAAVASRAATVPIPVPAPQRAVAMGSNGSVFLAVWEDGRNVKTALDQGIDLFAQLFDASGAPIGAPFPFMAQIGDQRFPSVAGLPGGDFLVAWGDGRDDPPGMGAASTNFIYSIGPTPSKSARLWYARISPTGTIKDVGGKPLVDAFARNPTDRFPTIATDPLNNRWLVAWDNDPNDPRATNVFLSVIGPDGLLVTGSDGKQIRGLPLQLNDSRCSPAAAWTGTKFFLTMQRYCFLNGGVPLLTTDIVGLFVDSDGKPGSSLVPIAGNTSVFEMAPSVAWHSGGGGMIVWEEHALVGSDASPSANLATAMLDAAGVVTPIATLKPMTPTPVLQWPRIVTTGPGYLLAFTDLTNDPAAIFGVRIDATGKANLADIGPSLQPASATRLFEGAAARPSPNFAPVGFLERDRVGPALAVGTMGQVLVGFNADEPRPVARTHVRLIRGRSAGERCEAGNMGALGCAEGLCERDADATPVASSGVCCSTSCGNPCQKCTINGCVGTPTSDPLCGVVNCSPLDTTCRAFDPAPPRCLGFGECASSSDLASCTLSHPINPGKSCMAPGCSQAGSCSDGDCVCPDLARDAGPRRVLPGCSMADGGTPAGSGVLVLVLAALAVGLRRRQVWALLLALAGGCGNDPGVMAIDLHLDDATLSETARVRVVIRKQDPAGTFSPSAASMGVPNETIRNVDLDGDGRIEIVADLEQMFPYKRAITYLKVVPSVSTPVPVQVTAQAIGLP